MPLDTQVKLLRVLESGEFSRIGSSEVRRVDVRVIAATNRAPEEEIRRGTFRADLFFRLNTVRIELPSLNRHTEDIPLLVEYFGRRTAARLGIHYAGISPEALRILVSLPWPGNVRELKNMVETLVTLEKGSLITPDILRPYIPLALKAPEQGITEGEYSLVHLTPITTEPGPGLAELYAMVVAIRHDVELIKNVVLGQNRPSLPAAPPPPQPEVEASPVDGIAINSLRLDTMEQQLILAALKLHNGNRRRAAEDLGISERTLYRKLKDYHLLDSL
jgi:DNA-binding NtrC family response regulator